MRDRKLSYLGLFAVLVAVSLASTATATILNPNQAGPPSLTNSPLGAGLIQDSGVQNFASVDGGTSFTGSLRTRVYTNDAFNPFGANFLTFTYLIVNNGPDPIEQLSTIDFSGYGTDVCFNNNPANLGVVGAIPFDVTRNSTGKILGWQFDPTGGSALLAGGNSALLVVHTTATQHVQVQNSLINGSVATVMSFGPAPVPEPASIGLIGIGLATLAIRRRASR
jgi:hypothetical protein